MVYGSEMDTRTPPKGIFQGTDEIIASFFGLHAGKTIRQKSTCRRLSPTPVGKQDFEKLVSDLYEQIERNRTDRVPSKENWRVMQVTTLADENRSPEILLERAIAILGEDRILAEWFNQIPVASGLVNDRANKRTAIDLMRLRDASVEFVELKWASDTPAFAAFEILLYGLAYLFCYINQEKLGYDEKSLMNVKTASLRILAPREYYDTYDHTWLGQGIDKGIRTLAGNLSGGELSMDFGFLAFPSGFYLPFTTGKEVKMISDPRNSENCQSIVSAINNIEPIWQGSV